LRALLRRNITELVAATPKTNSASAGLAELMSNERRDEGLERDDFLRIVISLYLLV